MSYSLDRVRSEWQRREDARRRALRLLRRQAEKAAGLEDKYDDMEAVPATDEDYRYVRETFSDYLLVSSGYDEGSRFWKVPFTVSDNDVVTFGTEERVKVEYVKASASPYLGALENIMLASTHVEGHTRRSASGKVVRVTGHTRDVEGDSSGGTKKATKGTYNRGGAERKDKGNNRPNPDSVAVAGGTIQVGDKVVMKEGNGSAVGTVRGFAKTGNTNETTVQVEFDGTVNEYLPERLTLPGKQKTTKDGKQNPDYVGSGDAKDPLVNKTKLSDEDNDEIVTLSAEEAEEDVARYLAWAKEY